MIPQRAKQAGVSNIDELAINTIRCLAIDGVQKANSGHPGTPLGAAPTAYALWQKVLRYDPQQPWWPNRDRFVLSAGHASMLLYALIHVAGVKAENASYDGEESPVSDSRRPQDISAGWEPLSRSSRVRLDDGRGSNDRSARSGPRRQRWNGYRRRDGSPPTTTARVSICSTSILTRSAVTAA